MQALKKIASFIFRIAISLALLVFLFSRLDIDLDRLLHIFKHADKRLLCVAFFILVLVNFVCILRWRQLLRSVGIRIPFMRIVISFAGGTFFNVFMPSSIGGDFLRSFDLAAYTQKTKEVVATVFLDRLSGYIGLVIVAVVSVGFGWQVIKFPSVFVALCVIVGALVLVLLLLFNRSVYRMIKRLLDKPGLNAKHHYAQGAKPGGVSAGLKKIRGMVGNLHSEIHVFRNKKKVIVKNILLSLIIQLLCPLTFYYTAKALGLSIKPLYFFMFVPVIGAITMLPISIGGLGLRDNAAALFFGKVGMSHDFAVAMSLLNFVYILIIACLGGMLYVLTVRRRRVQSHSPSSV